MNKKTINKEIRKISNSSSLPLLIFTAVTLLCNYIIKFLISHSSYSSILRNQNFIVAVQGIFIYLILIPVLLLIFYKTRGKNTKLRFKDCFAKPQRSFGWCLKWIIIAIGVSQIFQKLLTFVVAQLQTISGITPKTSTLNVDNNYVGYIILFIYSVLLAPFFEELLFRGTIYRNTKPMGEWFAIIMTGFAFGLWHGNYQQFGTAFISGAIMCLMFLKTKSIIPAMICHFINNLIVETQTISLTILGTPMSSADLEFKLHYMFTKHTFISIIYCINNILILIFLITGIVLLIIEIVKFRKRAKLSKGKFEIKPIKKQPVGCTYSGRQNLIKTHFGARVLLSCSLKVKKFAVYFSAPITIISFAVMMVQTVISAM